MSSCTSGGVELCKEDRPYATCTDSVFCANDSCKGMPGMMRLKKSCQWITLGGLTKYQMLEVAPSYKIADDSNFVVNKNRSKDTEDIWVLYHSALSSIKII